MKKCLFFAIIINICFLSVKLKQIVILSDKTLQGKEIEKESFINYNNISIVSNVQIKKDFIDISSNYLIKMVFNTFSVLIQKNYYYLLKFIIYKYLNYTYFDRALNPNNIYKSFFEVIIFHFNIINNSVLIDINICFFKSKNSLLNKGILIFSKKYFLVNPICFIQLSLIIYCPSISNFDKYLSHLYSKIEKRIKIEINELFELFNISDKLYSDLNSLSDIIIDENFELDEKYMFEIKLNKLNFGGGLKTMSDFKLSIKLVLNEIEKKVDEFSYILFLEEIIREIKNSYAYSYQNNTEIINSNHNYQIHCNLFLITISLINSFYSYIIFKEKEKISIHVVSSYIFAISVNFHFYYFFFSFPIIYELFNKNISLRKISINILNIISSFINIIFDYILSLYFDSNGFLIFTYILILGLVWMMDPLNFYLLLESLIWVIQIIQNFFYTNKNIYPLFFIIIFT